MRIAIVGPHGSGKTTLLDALKKKAEFEHYTFLPEVVRNLHAEGFDIVGAKTFDTQMLVMAQHMQNLLLHDNVVLDRGIIDVVAYTIALHKEGHLPHWFVDYSIKIAEQYAENYDYLIYVPSEFPLVDDGFRSMETPWHASVCEAFKYLIEYHTRSLLRNGRIIQVTGSVEERLSQILEGIEFK